MKTVFLDTSGLVCPKPLLAIRKQLTRLAAGQVLHVVTTDPSSLIDIKVFTVVNKHQLLKIIERKPIYEFWIEKNLVS